MEHEKAELPPVMDLPPLPGAEQLPPANVLRQGADVNSEFMPPIGDASGGVTQRGSLIDDSQAAASPASVPAVKGDDASTAPSSVSNPQIADDIDLIEKEWVERAKEIVEKTKDNPYLQSKAINEMKTDYIKKRYNKEMPSPQSQ